MNKREFVLGGCTTLAGMSGAAAGGASATGTIPIAGGAGLRRQRLPDLASDLHEKAWQAYVGHSFVAGVAARPVGLTLREVVPYSGQPGLEQFSLAFEAAADVPLPAGTHLLHHATGQQIQLYLESADAAAGVSHRYRADFSLLTG